MAMGTAVGAATRLPWWGDGVAFGQANPPTPQSSFVPNVELALRAAPGEAQILPGAPTKVWRFTGEVLKGPAETLQVIPDSYLGPVIRLRKGQKVRIRFSNALAESTIVHWHGLDVPAMMDGHPHLVIDQGKDYVYEFEVVNRAGTYWYHSHPHSRTGPQVYRGLAGLLLISDDEEDALNLPSGREEIVCVLQDRQFDGQNQLHYIAGGMMDQMHGFLGDRMLVNGRERPSLALATRAYRVRLLNGSNARIYKLMWSDGMPMTIIGTDGGLLEQPREQTYLTLAPAQRADVVLDLSRHAVGARLELRSAPFPATEVDASGMSMGGMMGGMTAGAVPNGAPLSLLAIQVARREASTFRLPKRLSTFDTSWQHETSAPARRITLAFQAGQWRLNDRTFDMMDAAPDETVPAGSTQIWELANSPGMMGMQMAHPIHLHGRQFRVLSRESGSGSGGRAVREGLTDEGWKDTVLVMPGETVRILVSFTRYLGLYLYHCHILEHEDMGMMRNFRVVSRAGSAR
jgi:FtsP/CotA-like multicopper oxidase with cupredoxin domain